MWILKYTQEARKNFHSLDKDAAGQILKKLEQTAQMDPLHLEKLEGFNYYKIRAGDYRALVVLDYKLKIIEVRRAGHRKKIYKGLI
ncbi:MAG: type II toxin-antitoxin system RelE/ParE family toxin [Candidatus ainarchaeum sp.]|nr:type II toxin-antitoxin system RelE/ParE family toxin [Candidatus ainarchaeum sp.]